MFILLCLMIAIEQCIGLNNIYSLPIDIQSNADKMIIYGKIRESECCGTKISLKSGLSTLDLKECSDTVSCADEEWIKVIIKTDCKEIQLTNGCASLSKPERSDTNITFTIKCICTTFGLMCPNGLNSAYSCLNLKKAIVTEEDEIFYINSDSSNISGIVELREVFLPVYPVSNGNNIRAVPKMSGNSIRVDVSNGRNTLCTLFSDDEICNHYCKTDQCTFFCDTPTQGQNMHVTLNCGNVSSTFWLIKDEVTAHGLIESHAHWRSHSKTLGTLFLVDIAFGYIIIDIIFLLSYFVYRISSFVIGNIICNMFNKLSFINKQEVVCSFCGCEHGNIYDALLHDEYCADMICPYCKDETIDMPSDHVQRCGKKRTAIEAYKQRNEKKVAEVLKEAAVETRLKMRYLLDNRTTFRVWVSSVVILLILNIVAPSGAALINKPCNKLIGMTSDCKMRGSDQILKTAIEDHNSWSAVELGMINDMERVESRGTFSFNALHRLKTQRFMRGDSEQSITLNVGSCISGESCKAFGDIEISSDVYSGFIQTYRTKNDGKLDTTFNIFVPDSELVVDLEFAYNTADWIVSKEQHFDCTETDCSKVCKKDESDKCPTVSKSRSADTSWKHNPYWCLSISSGCTCVIGRIVPREGADVYTVYKVGNKYLKALLCVEQNNIFIDCVTVDRKGEKSLHYGKLVIRTWDAVVRLPKMVMTKTIHGSNNTLKNAYIVDACEKNKCNMGDVGDFQFNKYNKNCESGVYMNTDGFQFDLIYSFATTPVWEITSPQSGSSHLLSNTPVSKTPSMMTHVVDVSKGQMIIKGDILGFMNVRAVVNNIELFTINDNGVVSDFEVKNCQGYYMSEIGAICTFQLKLSRSKRSVIRIESGDDSNYVQSDSQVLTGGTNTFRKFMFTRSKQPSYSFCVHHKEQKLCASIKYNLTDPSINWRMLPQNSALVKNRDPVNTCDFWFGLFCMYKRLVDSIKTLISGFIVIASGILLVLIIWILKKLFGSYLWFDSKVTLLSKDKQSFSDKIRRYKRLKFSKV